MRTRSFEDFIVEREYDGRDAIRDIVGAGDVDSRYAESDGYEIGRRDGTMCGLLIGSVSGAIMMLAALLLF